MALFGRETEQDRERAQAYARWLQAQNPWAIASLVLGVFSLVEFGVLGIFGIGGILTGIVALRQLASPDPTNPRTRGRGLAWGGIVTSAVSLLLAILLYSRVLG
jgi:hypothetical protein